MTRFFRKILCPTDFSDSSAVSLKKATSLASTFDAELVFAHIITNPHDFLYTAELLDKKEFFRRDFGDIPRAIPKDILLEVVGGMVKEFADEHVPEASYDVIIKLHEHTYRALIEYAEGDQVDLIVMSPYGRGGIGPRRGIMGSVAASVVRFAPCTVLVVRD